MTRQSRTSAPGDPDFEAIEAAVMETERGRWFLQEFARRNRHSDTQMLLGALARIENVVCGANPTAVADNAAAFDALASIIAQAKAEVAAIRPVGLHGDTGAASAELSDIADTADAANAQILAATECIQEMAWRLREQGQRAETCDFLDEQASAIYAGCAIADVAGRRARKAIAALMAVDIRLAAMAGTSDTGPAVDAADIPVAGAAVEPAGTAARDGEPLPHARGQTSAIDEPQLDIFADEDAAPATAPAVGGNQRAAPADPLAPLRAMSREERIALFT